MIDKRTNTEPRRHPGQKGKIMYLVVYSYNNDKKKERTFPCISNGEPMFYDTEQKAQEAVSDLNKCAADLRDGAKYLYPIYRVCRVEELGIEEPAKPKINVKGRLEVVRAMETIARAINHEGIFEEWLSYGVADGDIDETTTDEELMFYVESNETFGELMSTFTHMMRKVHTNGGLYVDGVASDKYNGR